MVQKFWFWSFCVLEQQQASIESRASRVLKTASLLILAKNLSDKDKNVSAKIAASTYENDSGIAKVSGEKIWPQSKYFMNLPTDYIMENYPENSMFYVNQGYLTIQKHKKMYYADYFLIGQIVKLLKLYSETGLRFVKYLNLTISSNAFEYIFISFKPKKTIEMIT